MRATILALAFLLCSTSAFAQDSVTILGKVSSSSNDRGFYDLMIVNKRSRAGVFGNPDGTFTVSALRTDTLLSDQWATGPQ